MDSDMPEQSLSPQAYLRYYLGGDGLMVGAAGLPKKSWAYEPFPLEKLMCFLVNYDRVPVPGASLFAMKESIMAEILITAWIADAFHPAARLSLFSGKNKKIPVLSERRLPV